MAHNQRLRGWEGEEINKLIEHLLKTGTETCEIVERFRGRLSSCAVYQRISRIKKSLGMPLRPTSKTPKYNGTCPIPLPGGERCGHALWRVTKKIVWNDQTYVGYCIQHGRGRVPFKKTRDGLCEVPKCGRKREARGLCHTHWSRRVAGDPNWARPIRVWPIDRSKKVRTYLTMSPLQRAYVQHHAEGRGMALTQLWNEIFNIWWRERQVLDQRRREQLANSHVASHARSMA